MRAVGPARTSWRVSRGGRPPILKPLETLYQQLLDRSKREHGQAFDQLVTDAQTTLYGVQSGDFSPLFSPPSDFGHSAAFQAVAENGLDTGETDYGRGGFRTCDLSRVKRALSH